MTQRAGLFLDLDGTLADSLPVMRIVYRRFLEHFGRSGCDAEFDRLNGPPLTEVVAELARVHAIDAPPASLEERYRRLAEQAYLEVAPRDGGPALIDVARRRGFAVAIVTSNRADLARAWLGRVGLDDRVECVVGCEHVRVGKPDPEPFLVALRRAGCAAAVSVAVEDSVAGAQSASAAGIPTFLLGEIPRETRLNVTIVDRLERVADAIAAR